ncbi:MAG: ribbon-helix-helix protein, CopG family [Chloroflexota bacterium]
MSRPTSFRLPRDLIERLDQEATATGITVTALVASTLDEGLKTRRFPGIIYRDGPTGRRAGLARGPDVWEVVRAFKEASGNEERRVQELADQFELPAQQVRRAIDFYAVFPDEIEARIVADTRAAERLRERVDRRERLLRV